MRFSFHRASLRISFWNSKSIGNSRHGVHVKGFYFVSHALTHTHTHAFKLVFKDPRLHSWPSSFFSLFWFVLFLSAFNALHDGTLLPGCLCAFTGILLVFFL